MYFSTLSTFYLTFVNQNNRLFYLMSVLEKAKEILKAVFLQQFVQQAVTAQVVLQIQEEINLRAERRNKWFQKRSQNSKQVQHHSESLQLLCLLQLPQLGFLDVLVKGTAYLQSQLQTLLDFLLIQTLLVILNNSLYSFDGFSIVSF
jgi:hypothetical protein